MEPKKPQDTEESEAERARRERKGGCMDHLNFCKEVCPDCSLPVDEYGNTENSFEFCSFPDCGCDGSRLCMAKRGASDNACKGNVEGMWSRGSDPDAARAAFFTIGLCAERGRK